MAVVERDLRARFREDGVFRRGRPAVSPAEACAERPLHHAFSDAARRAERHRIGV